MSTRRIIRTNGHVEILTGRQTMKSIGNAINASAMDSVVLRHLGQPLQVMLVDDLGHSKNLPVNEKATRLYLANCVPGTTHVIRGDVCIVPDEDFEP